MSLGIDDFYHPPRARVMSALAVFMLLKTPFYIGRYPRIQRPVAALEYINQIHQTVNATMSTMPVMTANAASVLVNSYTASTF